MSTADESHHEPSAIHDEHAAKTGGHGHDDHGAHDDHEVAADFIPENSAFDGLLKVVVTLAGVGLIVMMAIWWNAPVREEAAESAAHEHAVPAAPSGTAEPTKRDMPVPGSEIKSLPAAGSPENGNSATPTDSKDSSEGAKRAP